VHPILFQSLPYPDAERLVTIWDNHNGEPFDVTFGTFQEIGKRNRSFEFLTAMRPTQVTLTGVAEPERLDGQYVSMDYFRVLGVRPALGRDFQASEDRPNSRPFVVVISDALWRRHFDADPGIIGRQIQFNDIPSTVIGILPRGFENILGPSVEVWSTLQYDPALPLNGREWGHHLRMVGRLRDGVELDQAVRELETIAGTPLPEFPRPQVATLENGFFTRRLQDDVTHSVKPVLFAVSGAVTLLLAIACVNVTNLLMARGAQRRSELAVRAALGASRLRLVRQLLAETLLLAALGGTLGVFLAYVAVDSLVVMSPPGLPRLDSIDVNGSVLAFASGLTLLIGLVIGVIPALHGARANLDGAIGERSMRLAAGQQPMRRTLVVVQVAFAVVLLVGSGLLLRSLSRLFSVPPGFNATNLLTMQVPAAGPRFLDPKVTGPYFTQILDAVQQVPGVSTAAFSSQLPLTGDEDIFGIHFESVPPPNGDEGYDGYRYAVSPDYFEAMGITLRAGRFLGPQDTASAPLAAVINESFAKSRLPGLDPIGQRLRIGPNTGPPFVVVGVVADVKQASLALSRSNAVYIPAAQWTLFSDLTRWLVVRTPDDPAALTPAIRRAILSVDRSQPIVRVATMADRLETSLAVQSFAFRLFETFGIVALVLAAIGTYSVIAGSVTERTREIGVRAALGASKSGILALVLRQGMILAGLGIVIGMVGAMIASKALVTLLFGVSRLDVTTYLVVLVLLTAVSAIASGIPAWRASRISPSVALRSE
jgi:putative ABC transport system permease protein